MYNKSEFGIPSKIPEIYFIFFKEHLFTRLKKRMYNKKPVQSKRGPNKKKTGSTMKKDDGSKICKYLEEQVVDSSGTTSKNVSEVITQENNNGN